MCFSHHCWKSSRQREGPCVVRAMQLGSISQMINSTHEAPSRNGFTVPVNLQIGTRVICTTTLLDFGATTCFMDVLFGHTHYIPKGSKTKPISVKVIDKRPLLSGAIIEETIPLELTMGSHLESIASI